MFTEEYFEFFIELTMNNTKTWFDENRNTYEKTVRPLFLQFAQQTQQQLAHLNPNFATGDIRKSMFRINRDIRFAKDKTPYKTFMSVIFSPHDSKSMQAGGLYVEIGPENCALYSGNYMPEKQELQNIRQRIFANPAKFESIVNEKDFTTYFGAMRGEQNKRIDKPFKEMSKEVPALLNKQFYIMHSFEPELTLQKDFIDYCVEVYQASLSFNQFIMGS